MKARLPASERMALYLRWIELSEAYDASVLDWKMKWKRFLDAYNGRIHELPGIIFGYESAIHPTRDFSRSPITSQELQILWGQKEEAYRHVGVCFDAKWKFAGAHEWSNYRLKPNLEGINDTCEVADGEVEDLKAPQEKTRPTSKHYWYGKRPTTIKGSGKRVDP